MKVGKIFLMPIFLFQILVGCNRETSFEDAVNDAIDQNVRDACTFPVSREKRRQLYDLISSNTNVAFRLNCFLRWGDKILDADLPMSTNDYRRLTRILGGAMDIVREDVVSGLKNCKGSEDSAFDMRLKLIKWQQHHLDELIDMSKNIEKSDEDRIRWWRHCYCYLFSFYRLTINALESNWLPVEIEIYKMPQDVQDRIRLKIEQCLGRKVRTPEEVNSDWEWETETYKKVKRRELP